MRRQALEKLAAQPQVQLPRLLVDDHPRERLRHDRRLSVNCQYPPCATESCSDARACRCHPAVRRRLYRRCTPEQGDACAVHRTMRSGMTCVASVIAHHTPAPNQGASVQGVGSFAPDPHVMRRIRFETMQRIKEPNERTKTNVEDSARCSCRVTGAAIRRPRRRTTGGRPKGVCADAPDTARTSGLRHHGCASMAGIPCGGRGNLRRREAPARSRSRTPNGRRSRHRKPPRPYRPQRQACPVAAGSVPDESAAKRAWRCPIRAPA